MKLCLLFGVYDGIWIYTYALTTFVWQLWLCFRHGKRFSKFLPLLVTASIMILASVTCIPLSSFLGPGMFYYMIAVDWLLLGLYGIVVAWLIFGMSALFQRCRKKKNEADTTNKTKKL